MVDLSTRYPGLRCLFLDFLEKKKTSPLNSETDIAGLRCGDGPPDRLFDFWRTFAAACLADRDISSLVEGSSPQKVCSVDSALPGLSVIETLLVATACEGHSKFSRLLAIRYLGGVLQLPSFWRQTGRIYWSVLSKLLQQITILLKDLGVDVAQQREILMGAVQADIEGIDILCEAVLLGIHGGLQNSQSGTTTDEWYSNLGSVLHILRRYEPILHQRFH
ncbi:hypothetical protein FB45DRAFT_386126 [Roridomyces roridus]|uniref:Uncharacterized protein n=1 Tax=Roridomyces roridus TaxID=1738132 RepID=A0AAD7F898_9AGAR|nr:hypothetical protein FB45DRAFT_386126 [Roridomyces roridus]